MSGIDFICADERWSIFVLNCQICRSANRESLFCVSVLALLRLLSLLFRFEKLVACCSNYAMSAAKNALLMPLPVEIIVTLLLMCLSALFSGLNLGLMTLDVIELKVIGTAGSRKERRYANAILPVRLKGNWLLCSLLLGNTGVNVAFTILVENLMPELPKLGALVEVFVPTMAIVIFAEIIPQSLCTK